MLQESIKIELSQFGIFILKAGIYGTLNILCIFFAILHNIVWPTNYEGEYSVVFPYVFLCVLLNSVVIFYLKSSLSNLEAIKTQNLIKEFNAVTSNMEKTIKFKIYSFIFMWTPFFALFLIYPPGILLLSTNLLLFSIIVVIIICGSSCFFRRVKYEHKTWISLKRSLEKCAFPKSLKKNATSGLKLLKYNYLFPIFVSIIMLSGIFTRFMWLPFLNLPFFTFLGYYNLGISMKNVKSDLRDSSVNVLMYKK
jgi:hypothetical protein